MKYFKFPLERLDPTSTFATKYQTIQDTYESKLKQKGLTAIQVQNQMDILAYIEKECVDTYFEKPRNLRQAKKAAAREILDVLEEKLRELDFA